MLQPWLRLAFTEGLGPITGHALLSAFGSPEAIFDAQADTLLAAGLRPVLVKRLLARDPQREALIDQTLHWASQADRHAIITQADPDYPARLAQLPDPPLLIFLRGERSWLNRPMLAVVGSRNASLQGTDTARDIARTLGEAGWTIVSGLALGIDAAAHRGALETSGGTLAVLGCGIDRIYPRRHQGLADQVLACGALLSELPPGTPPAAAFFPQRNRLIAGLAHGVVVVEAAMQSGSLITARLANEGGREVFAVPGPIRSSLSRGCHQLIRDGATLIESAAQILEVCPAPDPRARQSKDPTSKPADASQTPKRPVPAQDPLHERILSALQGGAAHPDQLARHLEIPVHELAAPLLSLELQGRLITDAQGQLSPCDPGRQLASAQFRLL